MMVSQESIDRAKQTMLEAMAAVAAVKLAVQAHVEHGAPLDKEGLRDMLSQALDNVKFGTIEALGLA